MVTFRHTLPVNGGLLGSGSWLGQQGFLFLRIHCQLYLIEILQSKYGRLLTENTFQA